MRDIDMQVWRRAKDIRVGDAVDLSSDRFANQSGENPALECELQVAIEVKRETADCVAIAFDDFDIVGFPVDHLLFVDKHFEDEGEPSQ